MKEEVFIDTSAFYAALDINDKHHQAALRVWSILVGAPVITTNLVVAETYALILSRMGSRMALRWLKALPILPFFPGSEHHQAVTEVLDKYHDKTFSYADALSFVVMEEKGIRRAFSFDRHFSQYPGVTVIPG